MTEKSLITNRAYSTATNCFREPSNSRAIAGDPVSASSALAMDFSVSQGALAPGTLRARLG